MAIGDLEKAVLRCIATNRTAESYLAGATVLNASSASPRVSEDLDIFNDASINVAEIANIDIEILRKSGFIAEITRESATFVQAKITQNSSSTHIDWAQESSFRFFPIEKDPELGWKLNFWDAATNKVIALAQRNVVRDVVDIVELHQNHLSLGALSWAAAAKDPGLTPEWIIDFAQRVHRHSMEEWRALNLMQPIDPKEWSTLFREACIAAKELHQRLNPTYMGCLFLDASGVPVTPTGDGSSYLRHFAKNRGAVPQLSDR